MSPVLQPSIKPPEGKAKTKSVSKILVSEIHFCRFLFKLLGKIRDCQQRGLLQHSSGEVEAIMKDYTGIIRHKIDNLVRFSNNNFINTSCYE